VYLYDVQRVHCVNIMITQHMSHSTLYNSGLYILYSISNDAQFMMDDGVFNKSEIPSKSYPVSYYKTPRHAKYFRVKMRKHASTKLPLKVKWSS